MTIVNNVAAQTEKLKKLVENSNKDRVAYELLLKPKNPVSAPSPPRSPARSPAPSPAPSPPPSRPTTPTLSRIASGANVSIGAVHGGRTRSRRRHRRTTKKSKNKKSRK